MIVLSEALADQDIAMAFRLQDNALRESFNAFFKQWKKDGHYDKAMHYYFNSLEWMKELKTK